MSTSCSRGGSYASLPVGEVDDIHVQAASSTLAAFMRSCLSPRSTNTKDVYTSGTSGGVHKRVGTRGGVHKRVGTRGGVAQVGTRRWAHKRVGTRGPNVGEHVKWRILVLENVKWQVLVLENVKWQVLVLENVKWQVRVLENVKWQVRVLENVKWQVLVLENVKWQVRVLENVKWQVRVLENVKWQVRVLENVKWQVLVLENVNVAGPGVGERQVAGPGVGERQVAGPGVGERQVAGPGVRKHQVAGQIQWNWPENYGEEKFIMILGGLHIEMAALRMALSWLQGSGWAETLVQADIASPGTANSFLKAAHVTRTRRGHQITAATLNILQHKAYGKYTEDAQSDGHEPLEFGLADKITDAPPVTSIILDGPAVVEILKPGGSRTFQEYSTAVFIPYIESQLEYRSRPDLVWDCYLKSRSLKATVRCNRGKGTRRRGTASGPLPSNWQNFLRNSDSFLSDQSGNTGRALMDARLTRKLRRQGGRLRDVDTRQTRQAAAAAALNTSMQETVETACNPARLPTCPPTYTITPGRQHMKPSPKRPPDLP
ncbi:hypothetical protein Hamer_G013550 [Homarus americanus]|uniref:Uncharacterized protein n=1 Tax=Homarus americanus TaxID=6706 RepID=A0A8J5N0F2_HOMAM|nr:hypothetical protein Hamer_G013550 [Homarus americanus]